MFNQGYLKLFRFKNIPIRAHWTVPLVCLMFGGLRFAPGLWLGILLVILLHELGHAFFVKRFGLVNLGIDLTGIGGLCRWTGQPTKIQRAAIAWGGVVAQLIVFAITASVVLIVGRPETSFLRDLIYAFMWPNLFIAAFNLIPFRPFDGGEAWPLFGLLWRRRKQRRKWQDKLVEPGDESNPLSQTLREALDEAERKQRKSREPN